MLAKAILIITIVNSNSTNVDYAFYQDLYNCRAAAEEIMAHVNQRKDKSDKVTCTCAKIEEMLEDI